MVTRVKSTHACKVKSSTPWTIESEQTLLPQLRQHAAGEDCHRELSQEGFTFNCFPCWLTDPFHSDVRSFLSVQEKNEESRKQTGRGRGRRRRGSAWKTCLRAGHGHLYDVTRVRVAWPSPAKTQSERTLWETRESKKKRKEEEKSTQEKRRRIRPRKKERKQEETRKIGPSQKRQPLKCTRKKLQWNCPVHRAVWQHGKAKALSLVLHAAGSEFHKSSTRHVFIL